MSCLHAGAGRPRWWSWATHNGRRAVLRPTAVHDCELSRTVLPNMDPGLARTAKTSSRYALNYNELNGALPFEATLPIGHVSNRRERC